MIRWSNWLRRAAGLGSLAALFAAPHAHAEPSAAAVPAPETPIYVLVQDPFWSSPRGIGDLRLQRTQLEASPRQQTSEMLSAAPGFFVDHEDGEGLGNDVYLRGFDLEHGSGIEMKVGSVPINSPLHVHGQGYADANFIIPEVVHSVRVLEGPYDPRQGDAAIVGSARFDLGVARRGYQLKASYGSFDQARIVGVAAPEGADEQTFAAFSLRKSAGFGQNRAALSASSNAQFALDVGPRDRLRVLATGYGARSELAGVVRRDDVEAGRIGFYDAYPYFAAGQSALTSRAIVSAELSHALDGGGSLVFAPFLTWTQFRLRQNFAGALESSQFAPSLSGLGDLFETVNRETAGGFSAHFRAAPAKLTPYLEVAAEPGLYLRAGHTRQRKNLLNPEDLEAWDHRLDVSLETLDVGAYADLDLRIAKRLRVAGGPRADLLSVSVADRLTNVVPAGNAPPTALPGGTRGVLGLVLGLHSTAEVELSSQLVAALSYGEGFRSLDAAHLKDDSTKPYSKVRSAELGLRAALLGDRFTARLALFETHVGNELVFEAAAGGLETQNSSVRCGMVASLLVKPFPWLLASSAFSLTRAVFTTRVPGVSHYVPNIPSLLVRVDLNARGRLSKLRGQPLTGRIGVGYTLLAARRLNDTIVGPASNVVNTGGSLRYREIELGVEAYNLLDLQYADEEQVYASNWSLSPGQQRASIARHITAAPPRTVLATGTLYF